MEEQMVKGVTNSTIFLPIMSRKYCASDACKLEWNKALELKKRMLPIRLEENLEASVETVMKNNF
jgi:hypothetical protein